MTTLAILIAFITGLLHWKASRMNNFDPIGEKSPWWVPVIAAPIMLVIAVLVTYGAFYAVGETVEQRTPDPALLMMKGHDNARLHGLQ